MRTIVITWSTCFNGEAAEIERMLRSGDAWRVHVRKPDASEAEVRALIEAIPADLRKQLTLHDFHHLVAEYGVGGVHLNSRNPHAPSAWKGLVSCSLHADDVKTGIACDFDYAFLSPIYNSISKPGYQSAFTAEELRRVASDKLFALCGVTPDKYDEIEAMGFGGAAILGSAWRVAIDMEAFGLQFITNPMPDMDVAQGAELALKGGCRWVQLRHKDADRATLLGEGQRIRQLCDQYGATFIIDDHVDLVEAIGADGVHLGKNDMPVAEARRLLGPRRIIGATANCLDDIKAAYLSQADYVGLGPFRFTSTKKNLSPILGLEGYQRLLGECRSEGIGLPIVAIGGIGIADIPAIMRTGVSGIAISGTILTAADPIETTKELLETIKQ